MRIGNRLYSTAVGGLAYWLPAVLLAAICRQNVSVLWSNILSVLGLVGALTLDWGYFRWTIKLHWALAGVYIDGGP